MASYVKLLEKCDKYVWKWKSINVAIIIYGRTSKSLFVPTKKTSGRIELVFNASSSQVGHEDSE